MAVTTGPVFADGNIVIDADIPRLAAHSCYWGKHRGQDKGTNKMHEVIIEEFFR